MADEFNALESALVSAMQEDSFLGDSQNVAEIAEKLTPDYNSLFAHNFPHIGVFVTGEDAIEDIDQAYYRRGFTGIIEIACAGGYSLEVDTQLKTIMAETIRFLNEQNREDVRLDDPDIVQIAVTNASIAPQFGVENNIYLGYISFKIIKNQQA